MKHAEDLTIDVNEALKTAPPEQVLACICDGFLGRIEDVEDDRERQGEYVKLTVAHGLLWEMRNRFEFLVGNPTVKGRSPIEEAAHHFARTVLAHEGDEKG